MDDRAVFEEMRRRARELLAELSRKERRSYSKEDLMTYAYASGYCEGWIAQAERQT